MNEKRSQGRPISEVSGEIKALFNHVKNNEGVRRVDLLLALNIKGDRLSRMVKNSRRYGAIISSGHSSDVRYYTCEYAAQKGITSTRVKANKMEKKKDKSRSRSEPDLIHIDWVNRNRIFSECMNRRASL
jgi:hypothetical protein